MSFKRIFFTSPVLLLILFPLLSIAQFIVAVTDSTLEKTCGTNKVKCVFISDGALWFIDYSQSKPVFCSIKTDSAPSVPVISPDGKKVVFSTGVQSEPPFLKATTAWICDLQEGAVPQKIAFPAYSPRFEQNATEMAVIYATSGTQVNGKKFVFDGNGVVARKKIQTSLVDTIWPFGSWFGGMSYDGKWLCTGESELNAFMINIKNSPVVLCSLHTIQVKKKSTQKDTIIRLQTCNPSISTSRNFPDAMMYLDFSSDNIIDAGCVQSVLGEWGVHERIFISRSDGSIVRYMDVPRDPPLGRFSLVSGNGTVAGSRWENPEWANHPYFAAAALNVVRIWDSGDREPKEKNEAIYLLNLYDSSYVKIVELNDISTNSKSHIRFPWIWVEVPSDFNEKEDKKWLANSVTASSKNLHSRKMVDNKNVLLCGNVIKSSAAMISITLYSPNGKLLYQNSMNRTYSITLPKNMQMKQLKIVKIKFDNNTERILLLQSI